MSGFIGRVANALYGWVWPSAANNGENPQRTAVDQSIRRAAETPLRRKRGREEEDDDSEGVEPLAKRMTREPDIYAILNSWATTPDRIGAKSRIEAFLQDPDQNELNLSKLQIESLPNIFNHPSFQRLRFLNLANNQLTSLPESIGGLTALEWLYLQDNQLTELPGVCRWVNSFRVAVFIL